MVVSPPDVLVVGSLHLDIVVKATHLPALDETVRGSDWRLVCGGKGGNQACWAARLGARTAMTSRVGRDDFGDRLLANLKACGVDTKAVAVDEGAGSGMSVAILDRNGDYGAVIVSGANLRISVNDALRALDALGPPKVLVLQNEIEDAVNAAVARHSQKRGAIVILNAAPARALSAELAQNVDVLVVNRVEAAMMSDRPVTNRSEAIRAIPELRAFGRNVIATLGGDGLVVVPHAAEPVEIAAKGVTVTSTHGAGDCFVAQLATAMSQGQSLVDAAVLANATAAAYVAGTLSLGGD